MVHSFNILFRQLIDMPNLEYSLIYDLEYSEEELEDDEEELEDRNEVDDTADE